MRPYDYANGEYPLSRRQREERNRRIRKMRETHTIIDVAEAFGMCRAQISVICKGVVLKKQHRGKNGPPIGRPPTFDHAEARRRCVAGESHATLARAYDVSLSTIARVCKGAITVEERIRRQRHAGITSMATQRPGVRTPKWLPAEYRAEYLAIRPKVGVAEARRLIEAMLENIRRQMKKAA